MKRIFPTIILLAVFLAACAPVDLNAPLPTFDTAWIRTPGRRSPRENSIFGQHEDVETTDAYEIMITDVTTAQYAAFLNEALAAGYVKVDGDQIVGFYPGDEFRGVKHEEENRGRRLDLHPAG